MRDSPGRLKSGRREGTERVSADVRVLVVVVYERGKQQTKRKSEVTWRSRRVVGQAITSAQKKVCGRRDRYGVHGGYKAVASLALSREYLPWQIQHWNRAGARGSDMSVVPSKSLSVPQCMASYA